MTRRAQASPRRRGYHEDRTRGPTPAACNAGGPPHEIVDEELGLAQVERLQPVLRPLVGRHLDVDREHEQHEARATLLRQELCPLDPTQQGEARPHDLERRCQHLQSLLVERVPLAQGAHDLPSRRGFGAVRGVFPQLAFEALSQLSGLPDVLDRGGEGHPLFAALGDHDVARIRVVREVGAADR
ncbi:MAG: hypothetical protein JW751_02395 [Polyangiaceae bacterium]|nr:hypothetical protein [Polyangiaceae bacterium]